MNSLCFGTEMWEYQMLPPAREGHRCVGFDRRGHGRSDDVWGGFDLDSLADDLQGLLDRFDLRGVTLVGHSLGTAEIVRCLTRHGADRVTRVALVAGMAPGPARSANHPEGVDPELLRAGTEAFRRDHSVFFTDGAHAFFALDRPGNDLSEAYVETMIRRCHGSTARAGVALGELIAELDVAPELAALDLPVLVVHGTHDTSGPIELTGHRASPRRPPSRCTRTPATASSPPTPTASPRTCANSWPGAGTATVLVLTAGQFRRRAITRCRRSSRCQGLTSAGPGRRSADRGLPRRRSGVSASAWAGLL
ncbi:pimeloyl-ACP methyl ester carboxylesterase [Streptomyces sp. 3330]|nr:pimeloyl-ACP methyl ester carboxylesterase [Streptomyces sp. 3330]